MLNFICAPCKTAIRDNQSHVLCKGLKRDKTWCDCQHRIDRKKIV